MSSVGSTSDALVKRDPVEDLKVANVSTTLMNVLKFRRMTVGGESVRNGEVDSTTDIRHPKRTSFSVTSRQSVCSSEETVQSLPTLLRRKSSFRSISKSVTSILRFKRNALARNISSTVPEKPTVRYENTYRVEPEGNFRTERVYEVIFKVLEQELHDKVYSDSLAAKTVCYLTELIKNRVKELIIPRYRIVCHVILVQAADQGLEAASKCLWNEAHDNYTCVTYKNNSMIAIAMVHGVYLE